MIHHLFPDSIITVKASPDMWHGEIYPEEQVHIRHAAEKRRQEYTAGRQCCRKGLEALGITDFPILPGPHRAPLWPTGIIGSISHCEGYCGVAITRAGKIRGIGFDVEPRSISNLDPDLINLICSPAEQKWLAKLGSHQQAHWFKMIFSAKESIYKALFPLTRMEFDFLDIDIEFHQKDQYFKIRSSSLTPEQLPNTLLLKGTYASDSHHVFTATLITRH